tara:strand:+ start:3718 stop:6339 length:2622 start_codon:yes stop_codon:yes gene_type:complete
MAIGIGALMLLVNLGLIVTGFVDGQIESTVGTTLADGADGLDEDGNQDYTYDYGEDWINVSSQKAYFANSISNLVDVENNGSDPMYEKIGPFIYYENTTREILDFDYEGGTITYSGYEIYEWCEDCTWMDDDGVEHASVTGDTLTNQVNILWNTQRVAGMNTGIEYLEIFAQGMFAAQMIEFDLANRAPSIWASEDISAMMSDTITGDAVLAGAYLAAGGSSDQVSAFQNIEQSVMYDAIDPSTEICIALTCDLGPVLVAGMGAPDGGEVTQTRAALYGYGDKTEPELSAIDLGVYALAANAFVARGGGDDINNETPQLRERFQEVSGVNIINPETLDFLLFDDFNGLLGTFTLSGVTLPGMVVGLLLPLQSGDYFTAMETYNVGLLTVVDIASYAETWVGLGLLGSPTQFERILLGGQGTLTAGEWWMGAFGGLDPLAGTYIEVGLNIGDYVGMAALSAEKADFILNDENIGLKTTFSREFVYGELAGMSLPDENGVQSVWDDAYVANLYDIDEDSAAALRSWVGDFVFEVVMPVLITFLSGNTEYYSMPITHWLFGFSDAASASFGFFPWVSLETNLTFYGSDGIGTGDFSVYKMSTAGDTQGQRLAQGYINSDGDGLCDYDYDSDENFIGYDLPCEEGQIYGMTEHLTWRAPHREDASLGLLSDHAGNTDTSLMGTIGGDPPLATPDEPFLVNVAGYAIATSTVGDDTTFKGIPMVDHSISLDPAQTQIQGKILGASNWVDALPGALPVYLGADIDMKVDPISNAVMYGKVKVTFHLDMRGTGSSDPVIGVDTMPVFEIHTYSAIGDQEATDFKDQVTNNMGPFGWTNFGGSVGGILLVISLAQALFYVAGIGLLGYGLMTPRAEDDSEE